MKVTHTVVLFLLCLLIGLYVYFFELNKPPADEQDSQLQLTDLDPESIEKCSFSFPDKQEIILKRIQVDRFVLEQPISARADTDQITGILTSLASLTSTMTLDHSPDGIDDT